MKYYMGIGRRGRPLEKLLIKNSPVKNKTHLKKRLIREGRLKNRCVHCGIGPVWRGKPLTLEMDHINGDNCDNRLHNLRILCLNCHAQTPTFRRSKKFLLKNKQQSWLPSKRSIIISVSLVAVVTYTFLKLF